MTEPQRHTLFIKRTRFPVSAEALYEWHASPGALQRLTPPWEKVDVIEESPAVADGSTTAFRLKIGALKIVWTARHCDIIPGRQFTDVQTRGPFSSWRHTHLFTPDTDGSSYLEDRIHYRFKFHSISKHIIGRYVRRKIEKMFEYRHRTTLDDVILRQGRRPLSIVMTGSSGLIGRSLVPFLRTQGHRVTRLVRGNNPGVGDASWDPDHGIINYDFNGADAVIHLAGEPIGEGAWTKKKMKIIMDSRVAGTRLIAEQLAAMDTPPSTLICASAVGFYGDRGGVLITEDDGPGTDFISDVCRAWEAAARPAMDRGIRLVFLRIGVALHPGGGALKRYLPVSRLGLGGILGSGRQYISWISMEDVIGAVEHLLFAGNARGPVNIAAPIPVTNADFARTLARTMGRPALVTIPATLIRLLFGSMGREVILSSTRVSSQKLAESGYSFRHEKLGNALHFLLGL